MNLLTAPTLLACADYARCTESTGTADCCLYQHRAACNNSADSAAAEHGFAAASFLLDDMPDLNGEFALTAQYEQQAAAGVWGGAPAAASSGWSNGTSLSRAASWPSR